MRSLTLGVTLITVIALGIFASIALSQPDQPEGRDPQKEMQMMEAMGRPGPQHEQIKRQFEGTWNADVTFWMGPQAQKSTGTMRGEMVFGGRFLHNFYEGEVMGQPFEGAGVMGFDNAKQKYFSTWTDTMSTGMMVSEGTYDESTKTYKLSGKTMDHRGKEVTAREVTRIESDDRHVMEMYMPGPDGKEMKVMEIIFTRKN